MESVYKRVRQIFMIAYYQYIEWLINGKQLVILAILFFLVQYVTKPLVGLSKEIGIPLHLSEPFLATINSTYTIPLIFFCFITLMSEFPKRNYEDINLMFRTKRSNWYYGQLIFSIYAIVTFILEIIILFIGRIITISYIANGWSPITKHYMELYLDMGKRHGVVAVITSEVYHHFSPNEAFFYTLLLLAGMFLMINFIMMICNLIDKRTVGIVINILLVVIGLGMIYIKSSYLKYLPLGNVVLKCQNLPVTKLTERYYPILYFLIINIALIIAGRLLVRKVRL